MDTIRQDVRQGLRTLIKSPAFTATIILTLGLGIGANAAVFSIINTLMLRPLPIADPHNLYVLGVHHEDNEDLHGMSWRDYLDYRERTSVFSDIAAYGIGFAGLSAGGRADRIAVSYVTGNFFSMLGIALERGASSCGRKARRTAPIPSSSSDDRTRRSASTPTRPSSDARCS